MSNSKSKAGSARKAPTKSRNRSKKRRLLPKVGDAMVVQCHEDLDAHVIAVHGDGSITVHVPSISLLLEEGEPGMWRERRIAVVKPQGCSLTVRGR